MHLFLYNHYKIRSGVVAGPHLHPRVQWFTASGLLQEGLQSSLPGSRRAGDKPTPLRPSNKVCDVELGDRTQATQILAGPLEPSQAQFGGDSWTTPAAADKGAAGNPRLAGIPPFSAPKFPPAGGKPHCWMAKKGPGSLKSQLWQLRGGAKEKAEGLPFLIRVRQTKPWGTL